MSCLRIIQILGCDTSNGDLILDEPNLKAYSGDNVQWEISNTSGVDSIQDITEKNGIKNVWKTRPIRNNKWRGKIRKKVPIGYDYGYNIIWKKGGEIYTYDPKISINPTPAPTSYNLLMTLITLLGIASIVFLMRKNIGNSNFFKHRL